MHTQTPNKNCNNFVSLTRRWAQQKPCSFLDIFSYFIIKMSINPLIDKVNRNVVGIHFLNQNMHKESFGTYFL